MKLFISGIIFSLFLVSSGLLLAQLDPAAMATLSKLSPDQRQQLIKKYGSGGRCGLPIRSNCILAKPIDQGGET